MRYLMPIFTLLAGCAATPEQMAMRSDWDVCRFTMGGPNSEIAQYEAQRRGLDCTQYYGAINARMQAENAATSQVIRAISPPPASINRQTLCRSYRMGNEVRTECN